jgi:VIT1/CCC1 family predicted Fe2+/Mn2+ transporter
MPVRLKQRHRIGRIGWLRAAVLGANDGILSTASLVLGVRNCACDSQQHIGRGSPA